jgi:hypothetical protein
VFRGVRFLLVGGSEMQRAPRGSLARQRSIGLGVASQRSSFQGGPGLRAAARENTDRLERLIDKVLIAAGLFFRFA